MLITSAPGETERASCGVCAVCLRYESHNVPVAPDADDDVKLLRQFWSQPIRQLSRLGPPRPGQITTTWRLHSVDSEVGVF